MSEAMSTEPLKAEPTTATVVAAEAAAATTDAVIDNIVNTTTTTTTEEATTDPEPEKAAATNPGTDETNAASAAEPQQQPEPNTEPAVEGQETATAAATQEPQQMVATQEPPLQQPSEAAAETAASTQVASSDAQVAPTTDANESGVATATTESAAALVTATTAEGAEALVLVTTEGAAALVKATTTEEATALVTATTAEGAAALATAGESATAPATSEAPPQASAALAPATEAAAAALPAPTKPKPMTAAAKRAANKNYGPIITKFADMDVLSGRGAAVNNHPGNKKFRALCFVRKAHFDLGNHAAKRQLATEIVNILQSGTDHPPSRFLKKLPASAHPPAAVPAAAESGEGGAPAAAAATLYYAMTKEQAILKAQQVLRDYKRPDRLEAKMLQQQARFAAMPNSGDGGQQILPKPHRARTTPSTPLDGVVDLLEAPDVEKDSLFQVNPFGVHAHDVLSGRGAYVNGHVGNARLRKLATERKALFDAGNYTDKRQLANEVVAIIRSLDPPGRFLKKASQQLLEAHAKYAEAAAKTEPKPEEPKDDTTMKVEKPAIEPTTEPSGDKATALDAPATKVEEPATDAPSQVPKPEGAATEATAVATPAPPSQEPLVSTEPLNPPPQQLPPLIDGVWEELTDDKAIHKACQVMRDISRPDRKYREDRKEERAKHKRNNKRRKLNDGSRMSLETNGNVEAAAAGTAAPDAAPDATTTTTTTAPPGEEALEPPAISKEEALPTAMETVEQSETPALLASVEAPQQPSEETPPMTALPDGIKEEPTIAATTTTDPIEPKETSTAVEDVVDKALLGSDAPASEPPSNVAPAQDETVTEV